MPTYLYLMIYGVFSKHEYIMLMREKSVSFYNPVFIVEIHRLIMCTLNIYIDVYIYSKRRNTINDVIINKILSNTKHFLNYNF